MTWLRPELAALAGAGCAIDAVCALPDPVRKAHPSIALTRNRLLFSMFSAPIRADWQLPFHDDLLRRTGVTAPAR
jgi:hypothetical protein